MGRPVEKRALTLSMIPRLSEGLHIPATGRFGLEVVRPADVVRRIR